MSEVTYLGRRVFTGHIEQPINKMSEWLRQNHTPEEIMEKLGSNDGKFDASKDDDITEQDMDRYNNPNQYLTIFETDRLNELKETKYSIRKRLGYEE